MKKFKPANPSGAPRQKKYLSQVFLKETWPAQKMAEIVDEWGPDIVLEIGPGDGVLTELLIKPHRQVLAVEKDPRFAERLEDRWAEKPEFSLYEGDVLKFRLDKWVEDNKGKRLAIVGNIPYAISSPILKWLLPFLPDLVGVGLMTQLEFAQRLVAVPDTKAYSSLTVFTQLRAEVEWICEVSKKVFTPVPKVDSAIFTIKHRESGLNPVQMRRIETISRTTFTQRRKKLRNGLKPWLNQMEDQSIISIDLERRPGTLNLEEFAQLAKEIFPEDF